VRIVVTGAAGFIGRHLVKHLAEDLGHEVVGIDIADMSGMPLMPMKADITNDVEMLAKTAHDLRRMAWWNGKSEIQTGNSVDAFVHLAAVASPPIAQKEPERAWATNVRGTHNVLQLARDIGCKKVVFFSSAHVYGISPKYLPTDENHPLALHDTYTTTKIMGEALCRLFYENHGIAYTVLRLWNAYGPGQSADYFIGKKISQAREGKLTLRNEGVTKDWVHVSDVVKATSLAIASDYVGPLNVGTGVETSLRQIVGLLSRRFGVDVEREDVPDEGPTRMQCDWQRIRTTLGWEPTIRFEDGLEEIIGQ
jgi:nucleoside-diphosphate-sugar epimerase